MSSEADHVRLATIEAGVTLYIGADRLLRARPIEKITVELRERIKAVKGTLLGELLCAETLQWEQDAYGAHREAFRAHTAQDQLERLRGHFNQALSASVRGDVNAVNDALASYRHTINAVAQGAGLPVIAFPDNPPEYPKPKE